MTSGEASAGVTRRAVVAAGAVAGVGTALGTTAVAPARADARKTSATHTLRTPDLDVRVDPAFPRIVDYTDRATGATLHAQAEATTTLLVDGEEHTPEVTSTPGRDLITYTLTLETGTALTVRIEAEGRRVHWRVTRVAEATEGRVGTLELPHLAFLSMRSDQRPDPVVHTARVELDKAKSGDTLIELTGETPTDDTPVGCAYAVVATGELAAAIETNTSYDKPSKTEGADWDNGRLWRQTVAVGDARSTRLTCGQWTHRAATAAADQTEPLPYVTVVVTGDRNGDGVADWQDAAIAMRDIMIDPRGADAQHLRVVPHIPFNFASQATNPFLSTLDQVKRIHLATDGLRQFTLLKGYQSEGHDSAHPDYAGNYNDRAGGLADLNTLLRKGRKWNTDFAVHVNVTESYPVAHAFSEKLVDKDNEQWDWLDQSYRIDQRRDLVSGDVIARFQNLRDDTDKGLTSLYIDVFRESGWTSDRLQRAFRDQGWNVATEWGHGFERSALWSHWATETDYGADTSRGINSRLIRFIRNHQKDVFADKWPTLLGGARMGNYEGWRGKTDWHAFYALIWTHSLPAKYLQARPIRSWSEHEITFEGEEATAVTDTGGKRRITTEGRQVYDDGVYLLPWEPRKATDPAKLYHYNPDGGRTTWQLPSGWKHTRTVHVYPLTWRGRGEPVEAAVSGGRVTLDAEAGVPYVVHRRPAPAQPKPHWGEGTPLADPGFHSGGLAAWTVAGKAAVEVSKRGDPELVLTPGGEASVSQRLRRLEPGTYAASVQVQVGDEAGERRRAALTVRTADGVTAENWTDTSTAANQVAADLKQGTRFQRMTTWFTVPEGGGPVTLALTAGKGEAPVRFDHVRVVSATLPEAASRGGSQRRGTLVQEDFEHVPQGWGPFVKGDAGGSTDPRTHIAQRHAPYTQRGWNGKTIDDVIDGSESLKSRGENTGLVYRTVPHTVRFEAGKTYRVSFRYENEKADQYAWITGVDTPGAKELQREPLPVATRPATHTYEFTAPEEGQAWVGLRKVGDDGKAEFALDAFTVSEVTD
ncbi:endo-alpha-N-acetylgalactosaminidase family protein [Streptomyces tubbatahanensis]|uniref:Endo-alpha-N-acetylgalactosaminidase family protein n=1 Tax=Streptomyces tubbatahanensis TaxID=2923272 RepID=A0ABY3XQE2_9ACTN|nr:endo-alpha-N-acetylgalactosaminidase family protein [Streptomyces tubbatahanensis]UNS96443.1 endo-alpha-N-acetylgalactosaminidase family protein [Streptomyces tubbatahanensis]